MRHKSTSNPPSAPQRITESAAAVGAGSGTADVAGPNGAAGPNGEAETPPWAAFSVARGRFVRFVVVFCVALTLLATASIYWRWANVHEPSSYIVVYGSEDYNGTHVVVRSPDHPDAMATLSKDNEYAAAIFLHPGSYTITATLNGQQLVQQFFVLGHRRGLSVNLAARRPGTTQTATGPAPDGARAGAGGDR